MNILVTGGAGYIGSHTILSLFEAGHDVVSVDNLSKNTGRLNHGIEKISGKKVDFHKIDVRDEQKLSELFAQYTFDGVIHFAALKAVGESVEQPLSYYENNLNSLMTVCRVMKKHGVPTLIFSSSATVYGAVDIAATEDMNSTNSDSPYGWTKVFGEQILRDLQRAQPDFWNITLLRYFNPIGNHQSGLIGEDSPDVPPNLLPYITKVAAGELEKLTIFGDDYDTRDGTCIRDYIHVSDLAEGHVAALQHATAGIRTYNLGSGEGTTVLEAINAFQQATDKDIPYVVGPRRPGDITVSYADPSKAAAELHWKTKRSLQQAMHDQWTWQQSQK